MFRPKGYPCSSGFVGFLPDDRRMVFPTEQEYLDYIRVLLDKQSA